MRSLNTLLLNIADVREDLIAEISLVNSAYWDWFQTQNELVQKQRSAGLTDRKQAHVAPVLEKKTAGKKKVHNHQPGEDVPASMTEYSPKYYLIWKLFNNSGYRRVNKSASVHIPVANPDNIVNVVGKHCTWELQKFMETEAKLAPLRHQLDSIHHAEIKIKAAQRTYMRKFNQQKETQ